MDLEEFVDRGQNLDEFVRKTVPPPLTWWQDWYRYLRYYIKRGFTRYPHYIAIGVVAISALVLLIVRNLFGSKNTVASEVNTHSDTVNTKGNKKLE
jgi:hypothetical protein